MHGEYWSVDRIRIYEYALHIYIYTNVVFTLARAEDEIVIGVLHFLIDSYSQTTPCFVYILLRKEKIQR